LGVERSHNIVLQLMLLLKSGKKDSEKYSPNYTCGHYQGAAGRVCSWRILLVDGCGHMSCVLKTTFASDGIGATGVDNDGSDPLPRALF